MLILCPHCQTKQHGFPNSISGCNSCEKQFVVIKAFCTYGSSSCPKLAENLKFDATTNVQDERAVLLARSGKTFKCFDCNLSLGVMSVRIEAVGSPIRPVDGYYAVRIETHINCVVYHGTTSGRAAKIAKEGLLPQPHSSQKSNGFASEGLLRYVGLDRRPAENHATKDGDKVLEFAFTGVVAIADIEFEGKMLNRFLNNLPAEIDGIEFREFGRCLALKPQAKLVLKTLPEVVEREHKTGRFSDVKQCVGATLRKWLQKK